MRRVPKAFFDYADRGSYSEDTLRANRADLEAIKFRRSFENYCRAAQLPIWCEDDPFLS